MATLIDILYATMLIAALLLKAGAALDWHCSKPRKNKTHAARKV